MRTGRAPSWAPKTVVIQYAKVVTSRSRSTSSGDSSPFVQTVGAGKALDPPRRAGVRRRLDARHPAGRPIRYTAPDGSPLPFDPGQVWVAAGAAGAPRRGDARALTAVGGRIMGANPAEPRVGSPPSQ